MTFLKKGMLKVTTNPPRIIFALVVVVAVISVSYITALAVLAPQQLSEATTAATDLVCNGCVGTSDIANSAVSSAKIGAGQVTGSDIGNIAVTTGKISDTNGVRSVDIVNGEVKTEDIASGAIHPNVEIRRLTLLLNPQSSGHLDIKCPPGQNVTGGGSWNDQQNVRVMRDSPGDYDMWMIEASNGNNYGVQVDGFAVCMGPRP
jgi:hypothetical protein